MADHGGNDALSERHEDEMEEARALSGATDTDTVSGDGIFRGPYTGEEELAMSQFARAMRERDGIVKGATWNEFAEVVSRS